MIRISHDDSGRQVVREYPLSDASHTSYLDAFAAIAADLSARAPLARRERRWDADEPAVTVLLQENLAEGHLHGFGDPAVLRTGGETDPEYFLVVTSNDAPDSFPLFRSADLRTWESRGFVFPKGRKPAWTLATANLADFWAPELHRIGEAYWLCFAARAVDGGLAIGLAKATRPEGPYAPEPEPLLTGGVIDPHLFVTPEGKILLFWKEDTNGHWPEVLAALLAQQESLVGELFLAAEDRLTALIAARLSGCLADATAMERFFLLQTLIEAVSADLGGFRGRLVAASPRLGRSARESAQTVLRMLSTRIYVQQLAADGRSLLGAPRQVLENDQGWEGHVVEAPWVVQADGRYHLFYSGNDFSNPAYGVGVATADDPTGPYRKSGEPLLRSGRNWRAPGHPSVTIAPDGTPQIFFHGFRPGDAGYNTFRALLSAPLEITRDGVRLVRPGQPPARPRRSSR